MNDLRDALHLNRLEAKVDALLEHVMRLESATGPEWLTVDQVAEQWGVSTRTVQRRIAKGELPVSRRTGRPMVHRDVVHGLDG